jgi:polysaccharide pyruvyl transferase WcaK-like protein
MTTLLFMPAPSDTALRNVVRSNWSWLKSAAVRRQEVAWSAISGDVKFTDYHHVDRQNANRGDIAIGMAIERQFSQWIPHSDLRRVGWDDVGMAQLTAMLHDCRRLVVCGGGYIFLDAQGNLNSRAGDLDVFEKYSGEIIAHGIGLNRLLHESPFQDFEQVPSRTRDWVRRFAQRCKHISVRDQATAELFSIVGGREVEVVGDPALSLGNRSTESRQKEIAGGGSTVIGINTASHGRRALACLRSVMPHFERLYRDLVAAGSELRYFVHDDADYSIVSYLRLRGHRFKVIDGGGDVDVLLRGYEDCHYVVNQMLHSSILSYAVDVPVVAVAYDLKSTGFFDLFNMTEYCLPWNTLTHQAMRSAIATLTRERSSLVDAISCRRVDLQGAQMRFVEKALATS